MRKGTTKTGFEYTFDETRLDDMRFVDVMAVVLDDKAKEFDQISATSKLVEMLLGKDQKEKLYDHIAKDYDGRVPLGAFKQALEEIMTGSGSENELKN